MPEKHFLMQMKALPLRTKVVMTQQRIREWYNHWDGDVYVSFSGGKDSTVLAALVRDMYPDVPLVFCNTGLEYPEIQSFARKMGAEFIRPKMTFSEVISTYGYPIISKENAEAIYVARRIRNGGGYCPEREGRKKHWIDGKREELVGQPERSNLNDSEIPVGGGITNPETCRRRSDMMNKRHVFNMVREQSVKTKCGSTGEDRPSPG